MPFHFCHEEILAILTAIPAIKIIVPWMRAKIHKIMGRCPHETEENNNIFKQ